MERHYQRTEIDLGFLVYEKNNMQLTRDTQKKLLFFKRCSYLWSLGKFMKEFNSYNPNSHGAF